MAQTHDGTNGLSGEGHKQEEIERLLMEGVSLQKTSSQRTQAPAPLTTDDRENREVLPDSDVQGALGLFAEAAQDMATATVELSLGRHFTCADFCNQAAEKAVQSVSLLRCGRRSTYNHDLRMLGTLVGAPIEILDELEVLTPFHPETFHADTPPEEADEIISAEQASSYIQSARKVLRWAKGIVLSA